MSTPTVSVTPSWVKWLLGCLVAAMLGVLACCCGTCLLGKRLGEKVERYESEVSRSRETSARVAELDLEFPPRLPDDAATAALTDEDVMRFVRVRQAVASQAAAYRRVEDEAFPAEGKGAVRGVLGAVRSGMDAPARRRELLDAAEPALRAESMGPTDLQRMLEIVEWRFLRRPEARFLGLPEAQRREYLQAVLEERMLAAWTSGGLGSSTRVNGRSADEAAKDLERLRDRIQALAAQAEGRVALAPETVAALEARRAELEALRPDALDAMAPLTAEPVLTRFLDDDGVHVERSSEWRFPKDAEGSSGPTASDGEPEPTAEPPDAASP